MSHLLQLDSAAQSGAALSILAALFMLKSEASGILPIAHAAPGKI
jgi:hypothetical protein